jgi:hypothetical protein
MSAQTCFHGRHIGPVILAVAYTLVGAWIDEQPGLAPDVPPRE